MSKDTTPVPASTMTRIERVSEAAPRHALRVRAESLYEELGGDLCVCQNADVLHWCEKCQQRISYILTVFMRLRGEGAEAAERDLADARRELGAYSGIHDRQNALYRNAILESASNLRHADPHGFGCARCGARAELGKADEFPLHRGAECNLLGKEPHAFCRECLLRDHQLACERADREAAARVVAEAALATLRVVISAVSTNACEGTRDAASQGAGACEPKGGAIMAPTPLTESVLIWCFVCKDWIPTYKQSESCPRCGTDEIEHDDE